MNLDLIKGIAWLLLALLPFLLVQRLLHREIQYIFYFLTGSQELSLGLFSLLFFPGVILHELSHYLFARLVGVRTGKLSIFPKRIPGDKIQMGYVETAHADWFRTSFIGTAPLITGCIAVSLIAKYRLALLPMITSLMGGNLSEFWGTIRAVPAQPDFWVWFYLVFVISSTMLPSEADRTSIIPLVVILIILITIIVLTGIGPYVLKMISNYLQQAVQGIAFIFSVSLLIHLLLFLPLRLLRWMIQKIRKITFPVG